MAEWAGWFGSAIISDLVNRAGTFVGLKTELHTGLEEKLHRLVYALRKIRAVVDAAERRRQVSSPGLAEWLRELVDAAYEADDALDMFEYRILAERVESDAFSSSPHNTAKRLRIATLCLFGDKDVNDLAAAVERLERINDVGDFFRLLELDAGAKQRELDEDRVTSSLPPTEYAILGRDKEKEEVVKLLLKSDHDSGSTTVLPIVGGGGDGKTALAQLVYHDQRVEEYFDRRMWVCVSDNFNPTRLTKEILESASDDPAHRGEYRDMGNFDKLQEILRRKLSRERFLLVLDDVWDYADKERWQKLFAALKQGKEGSKILVTTRLRLVAQTMGTMDPIELQGLQDDDYWSLFKMCAFGGENPEDHPKLAWMGRQIADKLNGSPLAAKTVGEMLRRANMDDVYWKEVLRTELWQQPQGPNDIMAVLHLSYRNLPAHLQRCFSFCSLFPKGFKYRRSYLVQMWIAQGYINPQYTTRNLEDIGRDYFDDLVSRSFFKVVVEQDDQDEDDENEDDDEDEYVLHELLHSLAEFVSFKECFRYDGEESRPIPRSARHLSIWSNSLGDLKENVCQLKSLRTLIFFGGSMADSDHAALGQMLEELKNIRLLLLCSGHMERLPDTIGQLRHLRYLYLQDTRTDQLPESICRLFHLQFLVISGCPLDILPRRMNNLINLRYLDIGSEIVSKVAGIGKLTHLQQLEFFSVKKEAGYEIAQLKNMKELRGSLCIEDLENVESKEKAMEAALDKKPHLQKLQLSWGPSERIISNPEVEEDVLEGLRPHSDLKKLRIIGYGGVRSPAWMFESDHQCLLSTLSLESLHIVSCRGWRCLPPLGQLRFLKNLKLRGLHAVRELGSILYGAGEIKGTFPCLEHLELEDMPELEEGSGVAHGQLFPRLLDLMIKDCPKLVGGVPPLPSDLIDLHIEKVGLASLPWLVDDDCDLTRPGSCTGGGAGASYSSLSSVHIERCPNLRSLGEGLLHYHNQHRLRLLEELTISHCSELESLPAGGLRDLPFLKQLTIANCPKLMASVTPAEKEEDGRGLLPSSLKKLEITRCGITDAPLSKCLQGLTSLTDLTIGGCPRITSLPSAEVLQCPALENLLISHLQKLNSVGGLHALGGTLHRLDVRICPNLIKCPDQFNWQGEGLASLHALTIDNPSLLRVLLREEGLAGLRELAISNCSSKTIFMAMEQMGSFPQLRSLQQLYIRDCVNLKSLPADLRCLSSLKELHVYSCRKMRSLPNGEGLPPSLESLCISGCHPNLLKEWCQLQKGHGPHRRGQQDFNIPHIRIR